MLVHYGVVALPCRPYAPDLKGKVESTVGHTQGTALKGRQFESIDEQNAFLQRWNERWAFTRFHGTTKRQVREMFEEERPALMPCRQRSAASISLRTNFAHIVLARSRSNQLVSVGKLPDSPGPPRAFRFVDSNE